MIGRSVLSVISKCRTILSQQAVTCSTGGTYLPTESTESLKIHRKPEVIYIKSKIKKLKENDGSETCYIEELELGEHSYFY